MHSEPKILKERAVHFTLVLHDSRVEAIGGQGCIDVEAIVSKPWAKVINIVVYSREQMIADAIVNEWGEHVMSTMRMRAIGIVTKVLTSNLAEALWNWCV